jgi:hypothetical protein
MIIVGEPRNKVQVWQSLGSCRASSNVLHILQSKIFTHLVPRFCTNSCKSGTTGWVADRMFLWDQPHTQSCFLILGSWCSIHRYYVIGRYCWDTHEPILSRDKQKLRYRSLHLRRNPSIAALDRAKWRPRESSTYAMGE